MKELLERWARLEHTRCEPSETEGVMFILVNEVWNEIDLADITALDLMYIQWSIQEAIIVKGWSFWVGHDSHYGFGYEAEINASLPAEINAQGHTSAAEVLLSAYLQALEKTR